MITLVEPGQAPLLARPYYADGDPGPIERALAQVPELPAVTLPFLGAVLELPTSAVRAGLAADGLE